MKDGAIVADGPKDAIITEPLLSDVYGMPVYVDRRDGLYNAWC
jgi:ABC-type enterochelin transport system ATPase subunit